MRGLAGLALLPGVALAAPKFVAAPPPPEAEAQAEPGSLGAMVESGLAAVQVTPETAAWGALALVVLGLLIFGRGRRPKPDPRLAGDAALRAEAAAAHAALARLDPPQAQRRQRTGNGGPGAAQDYDGNGDGGGDGD